MGLLDADNPQVETSATQRAYNVLRSMIVSGELGPGEKLKIDGLRHRLDTGASPIREALSLLTSDYLVERIDQRGFRAAPVSRDNFEEILGLRCSLEVKAIQEGLPHASAAWEESVVLAHHRMQRAQDTKDASFEDKHKAFHMSLLAGASAPILLKFCSQLYDLNIRYRFLAARSPEYKSRDVSEEHALILKSAVDRDVDALSTRLLDHYRETGKYLASFFADA